MTMEVCPITFVYGGFHVFPFGLCAFIMAKWYWAMNHSSFSPVGEADQW
jgi:hypothetical protein